MNLKRHTTSQLPALRLLAWASLFLVLPGCEFTTELLQEFPATPFSRPQFPPIPSQSSSTAEMETFVQQQINQIRQKQGLSELRSNSKLAEVARRYSQKMAEQNFFSHTSPNGDRVTERVRSAGIYYWIVGENLFRGTNFPDPAAEAVEGWMNSPGHRENILRPEYRETGIGVWRVGNTYYFTQLFLRSLTP